MRERAQSTSRSNAETLRAKIIGTTSVYIQSVDRDVPLSLPVYAINWFNTNWLWLYNFYNLLAWYSLKKVGGKAYFKGRVVEVIQGDITLQREVLLIVWYPGADHFIKMMGSTYFKLVSIFRILSVKNFTFGFTQRKDSPKAVADAEKNKCYAIHHYRAENDFLGKFEDILQEQDIEIYYAGRVSSLLFSGDNQQPTEQVPCLMTNLLVLRADSHDRLKNLLKHDGYQAAIKETESTFIATLDRML